MSWQDPRLVRRNVRGAMRPDEFTPPAQTPGQPWMTIPPAMLQQLQDILAGQARLARGGWLQELASRGLADSGLLQRGYTDIERTQMEALQQGTRELQNEQYNRWLAQQQLGMQQRGMEAQQWAGMGQALGSILPMLGQTGLLKSVGRTALPAWLGGGTLGGTLGAALGKAAPWALGLSLFQSKKVPAWLRLPKLGFLGF